MSTADAVRSPSRTYEVLLTFATVSWQKGSAAQVASLVHELRRSRNDLRFRLLSHCPELDRLPAAELDIEVVGPSFRRGASRNHRSVSMLGRRMAFSAANPLRKSRVLPRRSAEPLAEAYTEADLVLDLSGDSYRDRPGGFALAHHANLLASRTARAPYALVSQSLGPFRFPNRPLARYFLNGARLIWVREERTRILLANLGVRPGLMELAPDVAFALPESSPIPIWSSEAIDPARLPRPWVAVSISDLALQLGAHRTTNTYLDAMASLARHVASRYRASVILVPHEINPPCFGSDDRSAAERLFEGMGRPPWMWPIRGDYGPDRLKGLIASCDALVAARMHAGIAGLSTGVPTLFVSWAHKYHGVMDQIGLADCVWDQVDGAEGDLLGAFDRLWERRGDLRERLIAYSARACREIAAITDRIADCLPSSAGPVPVPNIPAPVRRAR